MLVRLVSLILGAVAGARVLVAQPNIAAEGRYGRVAELLDSMITHEMRDKDIPALSIALVDSQRVVWARGFGWADSANGVRATAATMYRVGSVSKLFTDLAVMQLVERGALSLDSDVQRYLPSFRPRNPYARAITLRQLMAHRSGLVREPPTGHYFDSSGVSLGATLRSLNGTALVFPPESTTKYSNAGIAVVGYVLERARGEPFARSVKRAVLDPIGMQESAFQPTPAVRARLSRGQMWTLHGRTFDAPTFELGMAPAGSMYASVLEMTSFIRVLLRGGDGLVQRATLDTMWTPQYVAPGTATGFGLGFAIAAEGGERLVRHGGAIYGFATELMVMPEAQLGVIVAAAKDGANVVAARIATAALAALRAQRDGRVLPAPQRTRAVALAVAQRAAGSYGGSTGSMTLVRYDSSLYLHANGSSAPSRLRLLSGDTLIVDDALRFGPRVVLRGDTIEVAGTRYGRVTAKTLPNEPPAALRGLIGEYGWDYNTLYIYEQDGRLRALIEWFFDYPLTQVRPNVFAFPRSGLYTGEQLVFARDAGGRATRVTAAGIVFPRRQIAGDGGGVFRISPLKPIALLRRDALAATPPNEKGDFRASDLVELTTLDQSIKLDIRYATRDNFLSVPVYQQARAFLQRPAAEALVRAHHALAAKGYGLLIHDGYRPWYVTKIFWDATPVASRIFVADPSQGSRHNRGCAIDLTLYDRATGKAVIMPGGYDEMSDRSYPRYPGGTARQRALREMLREAMEREGFRVYDAEWWHFDYKDWRQYRIGNQTFEQLGR
jgi:CubicO group peptidase (beta-lactamase class C family)/D-alanyl-D-alanine dipeptidase